MLAGEVAVGLVGSIAGEAGGGVAMGLPTTASAEAGVTGGGVVTGGAGLLPAGGVGSTFGWGGVSEILISSTSKMRSDFAGILGGRPASP